jgi:hypothetical protein
MMNTPPYVVVIALLIGSMFSLSSMEKAPSPVVAQNQNPINSSISHKMGVRIVSPLANTSVPAGVLTIKGISSDTPTTDCTVSVDWNDLKPMQNVTATGPGGVKDYSNWTYTYTGKYHVISPGTNELTSKITCIMNPNNTTSKYNSINVTGIKNVAATPSIPPS